MHDREGLVLTQSDLLLLAAWCRARDMTWTPGRLTGDAACLLLEPAGGGRDAMLLVVGKGERRLLDAAGQELAAASDVQALFDAVDGGVADQPVPAPWLVRMAARERPLVTAA